MENVAWCILDELIEYLLVEVNHKFIFTSKLQSDYIELKFSEYWQPNGGGFYLTFNQINSEEKMCHTKSCLHLGGRAIELDDGEYQELTKIATQDFFKIDFDNEYLSWWNQGYCLHCWLCLEKILSVLFFLECYGLFFLRGWWALRDEYAKHVVLKFNIHFKTFLDYKAVRSLNSFTKRDNDSHSLTMFKMIEVSKNWFCHSNEENLPIMWVSSERADFWYKRIDF